MDDQYTKGMPDRTTRTARAIMAAHDAGDTYENLRGDQAPADVAGAYLAQTKLHELHEESGRGALGGRKIALASKVQQELCGIDHPIAGGIFANEILTSPAIIRRSDYHGLGIEFEMAVKLDADLTGADGPYGKTTIRDKIASVHPAFELIIDRGADYSDLDALTMIADNAWSGGVVLGAAIPSWRKLDLDALPVAMFFNDEPPVEATSGLADPLGSLAWVCNLINNMGGIVKAGETIITGSVIKTRYPIVGDRFRYEFAGLCDVELQVS